MTAVGAPGLEALAACPEAELDDLASQPSSGLRVQLCGDAHLAGRENGHDRRDRVASVVAAMGTYRKAMRDFAGRGNLAVWYARLDVEHRLAELATGKAERQRMARLLEKARGRDHARAARKLTALAEGRREFRSDPPLLVPLRELLPPPEAAVVRGRLLDVLARYRASLAADRQHLLDQFQLTDIARKVVGVGSVGTRTYVLLMTGRDLDDPLLLQAKETGPSVLEPYCGASRHRDAGERVVAVRQLWDGKATADVASMDPRRLRIYAGMCAWTLARGHARSGDRVALASYLGETDAFERALGRGSTEG